MRILASIMVLLAVIGASLLLLPVVRAPQSAAPVLVPPVATVPAAVVWAISFVHARPGQRERLERYLKANWLRLDEEALRQRRIVAYRMLRADADRAETWDYAVIIEYASREAMANFVPFYLSLARERPHVRVDGLDFADLGEVVQQKVVEPLANDAAAAAAGP